MMTHVILRGSQFILTGWQGGLAMWAIHLSAKPMSSPWRGLGRRKNSRRMVGRFASGTHSISAGRRRSRRFGPDASP